MKKLWDSTVYLKYAALNVCESTVFYEHWNTKPNT